MKDFRNIPESPFPERKVLSTGNESYERGYIYTPAVIKVGHHPRPEWY